MVLINLVYRYLPASYKEQYEARVASLAKDKTKQ